MSRKLRHQRNQEEVKGKQRSPKNMATATFPHTDYDTETSETGSPKKHFTGIANYQPTTTTQEVLQVSKVDIQTAGLSHSPQEGDHESAPPQPEPAQSLDDTLPFQQTEEERELDPLEL